MITSGAAQKLAENYLAEALPRRWRHVQGVGNRAESLAAYLENGSLLSTAAWLHDIGYSPDLAVRQFHPLDGARALQAISADSRLCGLVAYHSAAVHEARVIGFADELAYFTDESSIIRDLLWYLDMTTSPDGETVDFGDRMIDVRARYAPDHYVIRALDAGMADRQSAVARAETWLHASGLAAQV